MTAGLRKSAVVFLSDDLDANTCKHTQTNANNPDTPALYIYYKVFFILLELFIR